MHRHRLALETAFLLCLGAGMAGVLANPRAAHAQVTRTVQGVVRDSLSGETLPHASVAIEGRRISTHTNFDGRFALLGAPADSLVLHVQALGYGALELTVEASDAPTFLDIRLGRQAIELEGLDVATGRQVDVVRDISQVAMTPEGVAVLPSIGEVDMFRALQLMPGITSTGDGSGLYVRGGTPDQNLVLFDGMTMYHVDHFFGLFSAFNADAVKDVSVYTGGFPAKYGGRVSSVVDLIGKTGDEQRFRVGAGANLLSARAVAEVPLSGKGSWLIAARRSYTDILKSPLYNRLFDFQTGADPEPTPGPGGRGLGFTLQPDFYFYDLNSKLSYRPTRRDLIAFSLCNGADQLDQTASSGGFGGGGAVVQPADREHVTDWGNRGASGRWFRDWNHRLSSDLLVAASRYFSDDVNVSGTSGRTEENEVNDRTVRLNVDLRAARRLTIGIGSWWTESSVSYDFARTTDETISLSVERATEGRLAGAYSEGMLQLGDRLDLTAGLRVTHYALTETVYWEPRTSLNYTLTDRLRLKGAWGLFNQFVTRVENEDVLEGSRDFWLLADDELHPIESEHRVLGASYEGHHALFNIEVYDKSFENLTLFSTRYRVDPSADPSELFLIGDGRARGFEVLAQKLTGALTGWVSYGLARVVHQFPDVDDGTEFPAGHDQRHSIKAVGTYRLGDWELSSSWIYGSGRPYTAPRGQYFLEMLDGEVHSYIGVGQKNALRFPAYHRLDLAASRRFETEHLDWQIGLSIFNAYDRNNLWYQQFDLSEQPISVTDIGMLGITPSIDLKVSLK